jgi:hypothetical protein
MLFEKSYDIFLWFLVENILKIFFISRSKYLECHLLCFSKRSSFCFDALVHTLNRFSRNRLKPCLIKNEKQLFHINIPNCFKSSTEFNLFHSSHEKKNISFDVPKFRFLEIFNLDVEIVWKRIKLIEFGGQNCFLPLLINK